MSPPVVEFIDYHPALNPIVRAGLMPSMAVSTLAVSKTLSQKTAIVGSFALVSFIITVWLIRWRDKGIMS